MTDRVQHARFHDAKTGKSTKKDNEAARKNKTHFHPKSRSFCNVNFTDSAMLWDAHFDFAGRQK